MDNHVYNLCLQLVQENKALWRITNNYQKDTDGCGECDAFWKKMLADKQSHIEELTAMLKSHLAA